MTSRASVLHPKEQDEQRPCPALDDYRGHGDSSVGDLSFIGLLVALRGKAY